jgi:hypothetical protein
MEDAHLKAGKAGSKKGSQFRAETEARAVLARVIGKCGVPASEVARRVEASTGLKASARMITDWCRPSREGLRFPLSLARAIFEITGTDDLAFLAMSDDLRERAEIGTALRPVLKKWAEAQGKRRK